MAIGEKGLNFAVEKGGEFAEMTIKNSAKVAVVAGVLGIGTVAATLAIKAAEHAPEIYQASKFVASKILH